MKTKNTSLVLTLFLLGIFMGAIDSGIVSPAREIIQNGFGVSRNIGMWMITIYTLSYAVAMPIISKLADRHGHKQVYVYGIAIFALGSALCGLSNFYGNFTFFLIARVIQAVGAGGIMPIATTVIGQSFPVEKRGLALGMVGGIYGVATILGPTLGSGILQIAGSEHWGWIFFINVPISLIIIALSFKIQNTKSETILPLDLSGAFIVAAAIASLMYALTNLDFFNLGESIRTVEVFPYLIAFALLIPALLWAESRAKDPILQLKYFKNRQILIIFLLAFITGVGMMGMIFVPQFAENVLKIKAGTGGYLVTLLAVFAGVAAPLSGRLLDKKGARFVLGLGFMFTIVSSLFLGYVVTASLSFVSVVIGVAIMGLGVGFTIGAPINYLILQAVPHDEGATAMAAISLIRSIGVAISPSIMIGFIINAAKDLQSNLTETLNQGFAAIMSSGMSSGMQIPDMASMGEGNPRIAKLFASLQTADVTTIVDRLKEVFKEIVPYMAQDMVLGGIETIRGSIEEVFQSTMNIGYTHMFAASAVIAGVGFLVSLLLKSKNASNIQ